MFKDFKANYDKSIIDQAVIYLLNFEDEELIHKNQIMEALKIPTKMKFKDELFINNVDATYDLFVLQTFTELVNKLLTENQRSLVSARNGYYKFLLPANQSQYHATKSTQSAINDLRKGERGIKYVNTMKLTSLELTQRRQLMNNITFVKNLVKQQTSKKNVFELENQSLGIKKKFVI
jgi:hypothetical protein